MADALAEYPFSHALIVAMEKETNGGPPAASVALLLRSLRKKPGEDFNFDEAAVAALMDYFRELATTNGTPLPRDSLLRGFTQLVLEHCNDAVTQARDRARASSAAAQAAAAAELAREAAKARTEEQAGVEAEVVWRVKGLDGPSRTDLSLEQAKHLQSALLGRLKETDTIAHAVLLPGRCRSPATESATCTTA
jgi:hypothetical protein